MNKTNETLLQQKEDIETALAEATFGALDNLFSMGKDVLQVAALSHLHLGNKERLLHLFKEARGLCGVVKFVHERWMSIVSGSEDMNDPTILSDQANLYTLLFDEYSSAFSGSQADEVRSELRKLVSEAVNLCVTSVKPQVDRLREVVQSIVDFLKTLHLKNGRIILIELPIGNSIPVKMVNARIRKEFGKEPIILQATLARNEKPKDGVTRKQILVDVLNKFGFHPNDFVIYIDEWVSGSNFHAILEVIDKMLNKIGGVFVLPVGLMTVQSTKHPRYEKGFAGLHDQVLRNLGIAAGRFRYVFPPIRSKLPKADYFFWSEHDRTAGYRKMQIWGSIFSTLDKAIETLRKDDNALFLTKVYYLQALAEEIKDEGEDTKISVGAILDRKHSRDLFDRSYADYELCKKDLKVIDHPSNLGVADDGMAAIGDVISMMLQRVKDRDARVCVNMGVLFMKHSLNVDPEDRYYFATHAATILELKGDARYLHECWMALLDK